MSAARPKTKSAPVRGPRDYKVLFSEQTLKKIIDYRRKLIENPGLAGFYFKLSLAGGKSFIYKRFYKDQIGVEARLAADKAAKAYAIPLLQKYKTVDINSLTLEQFIEKLLDTKIPRIYAETDVYGGDGIRDWNDSESSILGDISITMATRVFDDGGHYNTSVPHPKPVMMDLTFVPGTLLRADALRGRGLPEITVDITEVVVHGKVDTDKLFALYERRLIPGWIAASAATKPGEKTFFTVPGLGCGQFAGNYDGTIPEQFCLVLEKLITKYHSQLPNVAAIYFDSWGSPITRGIKTIGEIHFIAEQGSDDGKERVFGCAQLDSAENFCKKYPELKLDPTKLRRNKLVAWDHYSHTGNEGTEGSKGTDDGVTFLASAAATNMTGFAGQYEAKRDQSYPGYELEGFKTLEQAVRTGGVTSDGQPAPLTLEAVGKIHVLHQGVIKQLTGSALIDPVSQAKIELLADATPPVATAEEVKLQPAAPVSAELEKVQAYKKALIENKAKMGTAISLYCNIEYGSTDGRFFAELMTDEAFKAMLLAARSRLTADKFQKHQHQFNESELAIIASFYVKPTKSAPASGSAATKVDDGVGVGLGLTAQSGKPSAAAKPTVKSGEDEASESKDVDVLEQIKQKIVSHRQAQGGYELGRGLWSGKSLKFGDGLTMQVATGAYEVYQDIVKTQTNKGGLSQINKNALLTRIRTTMQNKSNVNGIGFFGLGKRSQSTVDLYKEIIVLVNKNKRAT